MKASGALERFSRTPPYSSLIGGEMYWDSLNRGPKWLVSAFPKLYAYSAFIQMRMTCAIFSHHSGQNVCPGMRMGGFSLGPDRDPLLRRLVRFCGVCTTLVVPPFRKQHPCSLLYFSSQSQDKSF